MMIEFLISSFSVAYLMLVWFKTEAFAEYLSSLCKLLRFDPFKLLAWGCGTEDQIDYLSFLKKNYPNNFLVKLILCPVCLSFWLSVAVCLLFLSWKYILAVAFLSNFLFLWSVNLFNRSH